MTTEAVLAPGARVVVRDEEWLVRSSVPVGTGGYAVRAVGMSELVRNQERSFLTVLDDIQEMRPEDTELVADPSPQYRRSDCTWRACYAARRRRTTRFTSAIKPH